MDIWRHYYTPSTVSEALGLLAEHAGNARIIAGGTDLLIDLQYDGEKHKLDALVDLTRVDEMTNINAEGGVCTIGAAVTHTAVTQSALLEARATCLVESCGVVGGPQVRNVATLGGNVAHALPAGDGTTSLMALDAEAEVAWGEADGNRREWLPLAKIFRGPGISALDSSRDVLVGFRFRLCGEREGTAFHRIMRPQGVALPVLGCAVWVRLNEARTHYEDARISIAPVAPTPILAEAAADALRGQPTTDETLERVVEVAHQTLKPRTSKYRATGDYRQHMIGTLLRRTLPLAVERARTGVAHAEGVGMG
ncbi:MAG TPA: FAD binding domain-containing protein [Phototrophicaceae bacterium]|nr:FAD binding domain-containing protein [Phototrophicaceae bacterium]